MAAISFADLTLGYDGHPAVHHLSGTVEAGELLAICGPNGAGKSTLLKAIVGARAPLGGTVYLGNGGIADTAYLPQLADVDLSFPINVFDFVAMGLWRSSGLFGGIGRAGRAKIEAAIHAGGLEGFEDREIGTLSGGQRQRMLFARLIVQDARIILLDEPFTALDSKTTEDLLALVLRWHEQKRTVLAVLHDLDLVRLYFPKTLLLAREKLAWGETKTVLHPDNLLRAQNMIEAFDRQAQICERAA
jgi:zinc/manganese transport system ATP-binding protein